MGHRPTESVNDVIQVMVAEIILSTLNAFKINGMKHHHNKIPGISGRAG